MEFLLHLVSVLLVEVVLTGNREEYSLVWKTVISAGKSIEK